MLCLLCEGNTVLVARFFRLAHSRGQLLELVKSCHQRGSHFTAMNLGIDTIMPSVKCISPLLAGRVRPRAYFGEDESGIAGDC